MAPCAARSRIKVWGRKVLEAFCTFGFCPDSLDDDDNDVNDDDDDADDDDHMMMTMMMMTTRRTLGQLTSWGSSSLAELALKVSVILTQCRVCMHAMFCHASRNDVVIYDSSLQVLSLGASGLCLVDGRLI